MIKGLDETLNNLDLICFAAFSVQVLADTEPPVFFSPTVEDNEPLYLDFKDNEFELNRNEVTSLTFTYAKNLKRKTLIGHSQILRTATDKVKMLPIASL